MADDIQLLRKYAEHRDEAAFEALVECHVGLVYSAALRQLDGAVHRAEDVTQAVFTALARQAAALARRDDIVGWLYTITHHSAAKLKRTEARRELREREAQTMNELFSVSEAGVDWAQLRPVLDDAMQQLNEVDRRAILMRFFKNERLAEVGRNVGLSEDAARMRVDRALDKLHALLAKRGVTSTSAALAAALTNQAIASVPAGLAATVSAVALTPLTLASVAGGTTAGVVGFMSTAKATIGISGALVVLAVGVGVYFAQQASKAEASFSAVSREADEFMARLRKLPDRIASRETPSPAVVPNKPATETTSGDSKLHEGSVSDTDVREVITRELLGDPKFVELNLRYAQADIGSDLGLFYRRLGLTADQIAHFESILADSLSEVWRLRMDALKAGKDSGDAASQATMQQARTKMEDGIRGLLGENGLNAYLDHERSQFADETAQVLALNVYFTDSPLTAEQGGQLAEIFTRNSAGFQQGKNLVRRNIDWNGALADATKILTPLQLDALRAMNSQFDLQREIAIARAARAGGTSP